MVLLLYAGTEYLKGSGLLAVLGFGLALSNLPGKRRVVIPGPLQFSFLSAEPHEKILSFHSELSFLVRTFFFVLIGVVVQLSGLRPIWTLVMGVAGAIYLARWLAIQCSRWSWQGVNAAGRENILWMLPRGLITIVLALEVVDVRGSEMVFLPALAFATILITNLILIFGSVRVQRTSPADLIDPIEPAQD
jgi:cell volume regulation protein A